MNTINDKHIINDFVVETSFVYDFVSRGETKLIHYVNPTVEDVLDNDELVILFTEGKRVYFGEELKQKGVCVIVDKNMVVTEVLNKAVSEGVSPLFDEVIDFVVPNDSFVIYSYDKDYEQYSIRRFFAEKFKSGDSIKLKINNKQVYIPDILLLTGDAINLPSSINLLSKELFTTTDSKINLIGSIDNPNENIILNLKKYSSFGELENEYTITFDENFHFNEEVSLSDGVNYIDVELLSKSDSKLLMRKNIIAFRKINALEKANKHVIMWVEQFVNSKVLSSVESINQLVHTAKEAGITDFAIDVKGCEGYTAYKKATLSNAPYFTNTVAPNKRVDAKDITIDVLDELIKAAHSNHMKVYASINFFVEGNNATSDYAIDVPNMHPEWAEVLQAPEDAGELKSVLDTKRDAMLLYVNPANDEVQEYQLKRAEEVLMNYDVDGLIMDRARFDNQYADFSEVSRLKFEKFLQSKGKVLNNWPQDAFKVDKDGIMTLGEHYLEWITFRSSIIHEFSNKLRSLVNDYCAKTKRDIKLAAYVGSWYELYYQNGVNWADESFVYNERLNFPLEELYTRDYAKTSYIHNLDFIMIGCYYDTKEQIEKYVTLGNILMNNKIEMIGSISLPDLKTEDELKEGYKATFDNSEGTMIFDLCYTDWDTLKKAIKG